MSPPLAREGIIDILAARLWLMTGYTNHVPFARGIVLYDYPIVNSPLFLLYCDLHLLAPLEADIICQSLI